jgi:hypothetical protein
MGKWEGWNRPEPPSHTLKARRCGGGKDSPMWRTITPLTSRPSFGAAFLLPIERGLHAPHSGMDVKAYAENARQ